MLHLVTRRQVACSASTAESIRKQNLADIKVIRRIQADLSRRQRQPHDIPTIADWRELTADTLDLLDTELFEKQTT